MRCALLHNLGIETPCQGTACVYWGSRNEPAHREDACVLELYGLVGNTADTTSKWLYQYKVSAERARVMAHVQHVQSGKQHATRSGASLGVA